MTRLSVRTWLTTAALVVVAAGAPADEITFVKSKRAFPGDVVEMNDKAVEFRVAIDHVAGFTLGSKRAEGFPDTLQLVGRDAPQRARILGFQRGSLLLRVPRAAVARIRTTAPGSPARARPKRVASEKTGRARGKILTPKGPASDVEVRVVRVSYSTFLGQRSADYRESFAARTGRDGSYSFNALPVGSYKIFVQTKKGEGWIRRLRTKPDFEVSAGRPTEVDPVRIPRRVY